MNGEYRYGTYYYNYFILNDNKINHFQSYEKEYTNDYTDKFQKYLYEGNIKETENHYNYFLNSCEEWKKLVK